MYQKGNKAWVILGLYLGDYKKQFYLREISKLAKLPLKTTQNAVYNLEKERILKSAISGKNKYFRLNLDNIDTKFYLLSAEVCKTLLFIEKYRSFNTFLKDVKTNKPLAVFGSFAKFKANEDSDLDLLIITNGKADLPFHLLAYKIHGIQLTENEFMKSMEKQEALIKEIEDNHIILNNHSFYVNITWSYYGRK